MLQSNHEYNNECMIADTNILMVNGFIICLSHVRGFSRVKKKFQKHDP